MSAPPTSAAGDRLILGANQLGLPLHEVPVAQGVGRRDPKQEAGLLLPGELVLAKPREGGAAPRLNVSYEVSTHPQPEMPTTNRDPVPAAGMYGHCSPWKVSHSEPYLSPRFSGSG